MLVLGILAGAVAGAPCWIFISIAEAALLKLMMSPFPQLQPRIALTLGGGLFYLLWLFFAPRILGVDRRSDFRFGFIATLPLPTLIINYYWFTSSII
jgi:hypothetical protein